MTMHRSTKARLAAMATSALVAGGLAIAASGTTGAYFGDTKQGKVTGALGSIRVDTAATAGGGEDELDVAFAQEMMPGEPQTVTARFTNTGSQPQDVWVVFPDSAARAAINDLGTYGQLTIRSGDKEVFTSRNLNSKYACHTPGNPGVPEICPLPARLQLRSNVASGASGTMGFQFAYSDRLTRGASDKSSFNSYPVSGGTASGLPYQIVATQVGQQP
jgi:hypothetical protein